MALLDQNTAMFVNTELDISAIPNTDTVFIFVLRGHVQIETLSDTISLQTGDVLATDRKRAQSITADHRSLSIQLNINNDFLNDLLSNTEAKHFVLDSTHLSAGNHEHFVQLRESFAQLILQWLSPTKNSLVYERGLLDFLLINQLYFSENIRQSQTVQDDRINQVVRDIQSQFDQNLSLESMANRYFLSTAYLSRRFRLVIGQTFTHYLNSVRVKHAQQELLSDRYTLAEIAIRNGFNSTRSLDRVFQQIHGQSPASFKRLQRMSHAKQQLKSPSVDIQTNQTIIDLIADYLDQGQAKSTTILSPRPANSFTLDVANTQQRFHSPHVLISVGHPLNLLRNDVHRQLKNAVKRLHATNVRLQLILDKTTVLPSLDTGEDVLTNTVFETWDQIIHLLSDLKLTPLFEISSTQVSDIYLKRLTDFLTHHAAHLGQRSMTSWSFILRPIGTGNTNHVAFISNYNRLYQVIKNFVATPSLGVEVEQQPDKNTLNKEFNWLGTIRQHLTFIGYTAYSDIADTPETNEINTSIPMQNFERQLHRFVTKEHLNVTFMLLNWNTVTGHQRKTRGTFFRGALIANEILRPRENTPVLGFWLNTELMERQNNGTFSTTGLALFHYDRGHRPAYYALALINRLHGHVIFKNDFVLATKSKDRCQILVWNPSIFNPLLSTQELIASQQDRQTNITLLNLHSGDYHIKLFHFDKQHGSLYFAYSHFLSNAGVDDEALRYISKTARPSMQTYDTTLKNQFTFSNFLAYNAIHLIELRRLS